MNISCQYKNTCKRNSCLLETENSCIRQIKLDALFRETLLTPAQLEEKTLYYDADGTDAEEFRKLHNEVYSDVYNWVKHGHNLYLFSLTPGNGKTSWATKIIRGYIYRIWPEASLTCKALFIHVPTFLLELKASISKDSAYIDHILNSIESADLVVWDDIATKTTTEFEGENLLSYLERRLMQGKANIFTSNVLPSDLHNAVGDRLTSRILNASEVIEFNGTDKRSLR